MNYEFALKLLACNYEICMNNYKENDGMGYGMAMEQWLIFHNKHL